MKKGQLFPVLLLIIFAAVVAFVSQRQWTEEVYTVAVAPREGVTVLGDNPVAVEPGGTAVFKLEFDANFQFGSASAGDYSNGELVVSNVNNSRTIYLQPLKYCKLTLNQTSNGTAMLSSTDVLAEGETASIQLVPDDNYVNGQIEVNGVVYPPPYSDSFSFVVSDDSEVTVHFLGKELEFYTVSGNLGHIKIANASEVYRYGDILTLECEYNSDHILFNGWSKGGFLSNGGELVSADAQYEFTLVESTTLYANFADRSAYLLSYDANDGEEAQTIVEEHAVGEFCNVLLNDCFVKEGYTLVGFSTQADGNSELLTPGAMLEMPGRDITLYAQWAENTSPTHLKYSAYGNEVVVEGLSETGLEMGLTDIVIPDVIDGKKVTSIRAGAFRGNTSLITVVLPVGLREIGDFSFADCSSLTTVYFPETLASIAYSAFDNSDSFTNMRVIASMQRAFDYDYDSGLALKYMRLKNEPGKRIILIGGSNLAFGINSALIAEEFPEYSIINMGVSMYYGILPTFDYLKANIHKGDVIVFCPEYSLEMYAARDIQAITNWQYLESNYDMLKDINLQENMSLLRFYTEYLATKQSYLPGKKINAKLAYARTGFNEYGDMAADRPAYGSYDFVLPDTQVITENGMRRYNELCKHLTEKGAECYFSFPVQSSGGNSTEYIKNNTRVFMDKLDSGLDDKYCTIISDISDYYLESNLFYDSNYHLILEGADIRTAKLIEDLKTYLEE